MPVDKCLLVGFKTASCPDAFAYCGLHNADRPDADACVEYGSDEHDAFLKEAALNPWLGRLEVAYIWRVQKGIDPDRFMAVNEKALVNVVMQALAEWDSCAEDQVQLVGFAPARLLGFMSVSALLQSDRVMSASCDDIRQSVKLVDVCSLLAGISGGKALSPEFYRARLLRSPARCAGRRLDDPGEDVTTVAQLMLRLPGYEELCDELQAVVSEEKKLCRKMSRRA